MGREEFGRASREELIDLVIASHARLEEVEQQLRWFKQQVFGAKSERRVAVDPSQLSLGEGLVEPPLAEGCGDAGARACAPPATREGRVEDPGLRFDDTVPVQRIVVEDPALEGLREGVDYTVVSEKKSYRLAQQPASYTVLEVVRPVVKLAETGKLAARGQRSQPLVAAFFAWLEPELVEHALLPTNPFTKAARYALERKKGLEVFLTDPDVPIDTNHLERALRPIPLGRKNWLFCWTEVGAEVVGRVQSLISTCVLHDVDPYTYLVDVLQRIDTHPFAQVAQLTPRLWKERFAGDPLRSLLDAATT